MAIAVFGCWLYPVYGIPSSETQGTVLLIIIEFYIFGSTFAHMLAAALPDAQTAGNIATFMFTLIVAFNGVFVTPSALPGFWTFLYRVSPLTYVVAALSGTALHDRPITCAENELVVFSPAPSTATNASQTCGSYLDEFLINAPGRLLNPGAFDNCQYCSIQNTDQLLAGYGVVASDRWRDFGIVWAFIAFNILATFFLYWAVRVDHGKRVPMKRK